MADVDVSAVVTCVATIVSAYNDALKLLDRIRTEGAPKTRPGSTKALDDLKSSLTLGPVVIRAQYDNDFRRFGETYAQGDHIACEQLKDIIINLQMTLITSLRMYLANDRIAIDMDELQTASDNSRVDSSMALCQLYQRLATATRSPPLLTKSPPLKSLPLVPRDRKLSKTSNKTPPPLSQGSRSRSGSNSNRHASINISDNGGWTLFPATKMSPAETPAADSSRLSTCSSNSSDTIPSAMSPVIRQLPSSSPPPMFSFSPPVSPATYEPPARASKDSGISGFRQQHQISEPRMKKRIPTNAGNDSNSKTSPVSPGKDSLDHIHPALRGDREIRMRELRLQLPEMPPPPTKALPIPQQNKKRTDPLLNSPLNDSSIEPIYEERVGNDSTSSIYSRNTDTNNSDRSHTSHSFRGSVGSISPMKLYLPSEDNQFGGFCKGAWKLQIGLKKSFQIHKRPVGFYSDILYWRCSKCTYEGPARGGPAKSTLTFDDSVQVDKATGVRYKWRFLAKSHVQMKKVPKVTDGSAGLFGCIFCSAMHNTPALVFDNLPGFMEHLSRQHRQMPPGCEALLQRTGCVVGRQASEEEDWEVNIV
ncbi:hypothetical protein BGW36DRAFT_353992 [Talaromyces proteolyticus]|uniref:Uncharacterized protein n=1 Tax=Talaromyces proteolyticus TaxID=1131652 RepID=A0AAD4L2U7_9EURO|nr:uncharacterized protein BGW36DRAFT_353992 [Talaromyces proteolyticus]KAH8705591.1 hypothetical protein BGW36DRAFT_353992 [Talaromyces proteolyticus]